MEREPDWASELPDDPDDDTPLDVLTGTVPHKPGTRPLHMPPGPTTLRHPGDGNTGWQTKAGQSEARRLQVIQLVRDGLTYAQARREVGVHENTELRWRKTYPEYLIALTDARYEAEQQGRRTTYRNSGHMADLRTTDFVKFRKTFFHHDTAPHHLLMVETIERARPGDIVNILAAPGLGKTTVLVDYINYKLALDPNLRFALFSEGQNLARKNLGQIAKRFTDDRNFAHFIATYGPFRTPKDQADKRYLGRDNGTRWTADDIRVFKADHDEKEASVESLGWGSAVYGGRYDRMVYDDLQSTKNLNATDRIINWLRQDAITRPGHTDGAHIIIGSRVGRGDIYETMAQEQMLARQIHIPAMTSWVDRDEHYVVSATGKIRVNPNCPAKPTWDAWTLQTLAQRRHLVKEEIWTRTYMLQNFNNRDATFTEQMLEQAKDRTAGVREPFGTMTIGSVDPALGKGICAFTIAGLDSNRMLLREQYTKQGFRTYDDIYHNIAVLSEKYRPSVWVIEDNAFQQGLINAPQLIELQRKFGFQIQSHKTARNKHDPVYGVAMMASAFTEGELKFPWAGQDEIEMFGPLIDELRAWTPDKRGGQLVQDRVVGAWFCWKHWQEIRGVAWNTGPRMRRNTPSWMRNGGRGVA